MYDGLVNFRDIGGWHTTFASKVQTDAVYRAGMFSFVGEAASDILFENLGVRTVIDLRMDHELAAHPPPPMYSRHPDLKAVHLPFFGSDDIEDLSLPRGFEPEPWAIRYAAYTDVAGRHAVVDVFEEILADDGSPTVFHCWSGKDRTGLTTAMLLDLLGVDDADIGREYERSMEWWLPRIGDKELSEGEPDAGYHTVSAVITLALQELRSRYGTIEQMLTQSGMRPDLPDRLRAMLLA